ncbi:LOW QUALITY PROTEIN: patatin-like phospholipase domain-containing protein 5 [Sorex fumeus]|uniref:LOW QUALITY PROTEIN: patatin-like phospholipase domain-containing protein 5 n=1 Tax=Sorex fumeus TaxID=62283 RepID=UPI0024AE6C39|nr:LOW QUALITY PROTEIN: patatin-like phospholipase domain-containing protein 5 [Sorex fumeus]
MRAFQEPGSWSLSFVGAGFLGLYHVGACQCLQERAPELLRGARRLYGSSSGALNAVSLVCGKSAEFCCERLLGLVKEVERLSLGILHPAFWPVEHIRRELEHHLPADVHIRASERLGISLTRWPDGQNCIITHFASREEVIQALICTLYVPFYCGVIPAEFRGERYFDGALSNNLPYSDCGRTITVSPFSGTVDICPQSLSASMHEFQAFQACFQISSRNVERGIHALLPPSPEVVADCCRQGYLDALRFLERRGLTKEPVLWTLVCAEPPAPAEGTPDPTTGLCIDWTVPSVWVSDVPDFQKLSPKLEAALQKACRRDPAPWARFCRSVPGQALTYLLLPYTLPLQYIYFRGKRLVLWLPQMPTDLRWIQDQLRSAAALACTQMKKQLLGPASLPAAGPLLPGSAPAGDHLGRNGETGLRPARL